MSKQKKDAEKENLAEATPAPASDTSMSDAGSPDKTIERGGPKGPGPFGPPRSMVLSGEPASDILVSEAGAGVASAKLSFSASFFCLLIVFAFLMLASADVF